MIYQPSQAPNVFVRSNDSKKQADKAKIQFLHPDGDHLTMLNVTMHLNQASYVSLNCFKLNYAYNQLIQPTVLCRKLRSQVVPR
ncbi:hypothetical protein BC937DRAFT_91019 [Endogone sp. FLAS-F59071]|nr:hypothetical protein BC937DRAFT_91019 [Endogone sp. FLAS-F59071]|eukprot:RUS16599.1 hypothetical protein BC937DRAFT_91019 [Endogone sp. FLAS-F59071]